MNRAQRGFVISLTLIGAFLIFFGAMPLYFRKAEIKGSFTQAYDIFEANAEDIKVGDAIKTELYCSFGTFAELETVKKTEGGTVVSRSSQDYYIIPIFGENDELYYIAYESTKNTAADMEAIVDETYDYFSGYSDTLGTTTIEFEGTLKPLSDKAYGYLKEWFEEEEMFESEEELEAHVLPMYLDGVELLDSRFQILSAMILVLAGIACIVGGFIYRKNATAAEEAFQEDVHAAFEIEELERAYQQERA